MTSLAPGQAPAPESLLDLATLRAASDTALSHTAATVQAEQHRRALADNDLDAVLEEAFLRGFTPTGHPLAPWVAGGLLICPGFVRYKSATSHECEFASADGVWVWEHPQLVRDVMRQVPGPKVLKQSVSILLAVEGLALDVVQSAAKSGAACQMQKATSYQIQAGQLQVVATRARVVAGHSRS